MPVTNNVTRMLAAKGVAFEAHELPAEKLGGLEAAAFLSVDPNQMFKTIVALHPEGGKPVLAIIPAPAQLDLKALGRSLGGKKLQVATQARAEELTGLQVGGISPLALLGKGFEAVIDESALGFEKIFLSGGQRGLNLSLSPKILVDLIRAKVFAISEKPRI
ncbi:MAG: YbaK/EbsC family protein [Anaerolineales bacterium]